MRLDIEVYSGIAPPKELLDAMAEAKAGVRRPNKADNGKKFGEKLQTNLHMNSDASIPPTPMEPVSDGMPDTPAQEGNTAPPAPAPAYSDAPPSYEDAVASSLPPVAAHRPDYAPPAAEEDDLLRGDEKKQLGSR